MRERERNREATHWCSYYKKVVLGEFAGFPNFETDLYLIAHHDLIQSKISLKGKGIPCKMLSGWCHQAKFTKQKNSIVVNHPGCFGQIFEDHPDFCPDHLFSSIF